MKRFIPISLALVALLVLIAVPIYRSSAEGPAPVPAAAGQKWEYAELLAGDFHSGNSFSFASSESYAEDTTPDGLREKLGGMGRIDKHLPAPSEIQMALFNQIGSKGWELVSVAPEGVWGASKAKEADYTNYSGASRVYLFKRAAQMK